MTALQVQILSIFRNIPDNYFIPNQTFFFKKFFQGKLNHPLFQRGDLEFLRMFVFISGD